MHKAAIALFLAALAWAGPARAGTVAFEDHGLLESGQWQLNSIFSVFPNTQRVEGTRVSALEPGEASYLGQFAQEFRYGLSDRLMVRTTLPLSVLQGAGSSQSAGLGDWEVFVKAGLLTDEEAPCRLSAGLQVIMPTSLPTMFSINGTTNVVPSLVLNTRLPLGELTASLGYARPLDYQSEGHVLHPSDAVVYALGWCTDLGEQVNLTLDMLGTETLEARLDGVADPASAGRQITLGPGLTWHLDGAQALLCSVQAPLWRQGLMEASQPLTGMLQYSVTF